MAWLESILAKIGDWIVLYGLQVLGAILILVLGYIAAKIVKKIVAKLMDKAKVEPTLTRFVASLASIGVLAFAVIAALSKAGIQTTSFIAVLGAAGLAIGLALQGSLANFAGGVMLILFKPCKAGDFIEGAGTMGTIEEVGIFTTILATPDNKTVIVPNAKLTGDNITNYTRKGTRRVDMVIGVAYDADLKQTAEVIAGVLEADERVLAEPETTIAVCELGDSSVNFAVRPWVNATDYWGVLFDTLETVKIKLDEAGIGIPFPQRDVHLYNEKK